MSALEKALVEEFKRCENLRQVYLEKIRELPTGYLSQKTIKGKIYFYLQHREGEKIISKYVPKKDVDMMQRLLETRKSFEQKIKAIEDDQKKIRKAVGPLVNSMV